MVYLVIISYKSILAVIIGRARDWRTVSSYLVDRQGKKSEEMPRFVYKKVRFLQLLQECHIYKALYAKCYLNSLIFHEQTYPWTVLGFLDTGKITASFSLLLVMFGILHIYRVSQKMVHF